MMRWHRWMSVPAWTADATAGLRPPKAFAEFIKRDRRQREEAILTRQGGGCDAMGGLLWICRSQPRVRRIDRIVVNMRVYSDSPRIP
jgi:hypothetical protein